MSNLSASNDVFLIVGVFFTACIPFLLLFKLKDKNLVKVEQKIEQHLID